jgi:ComF family protein
MVYSWSFFERLRWPASCLLCERPGASHPLCAACTADLPLNRQACPRCALPLPAGQAVCAACLAAPPLQSRTQAPLRYEFPVDHLIAGLKYHGRLAHAPLLGILLRDHVLATGAALPDLLLPVPLHHQRLAERGYNQALEIARPVARATGLALETRLLQRVRATAPQMSLDAGTRARNPQGAFALDTGRLEQLGRPAHVALIDDVMTTGATLAEIASLLQQAGIARIEFWAVARTH